VENFGLELAPHTSKNIQHAYGNEKEAMSIKRQG